MTGLDLVTFLRLLRADLGAWLSLGAIIAILALLAWTSWGRKRALRKCLVLSIAAHIGLVVYGRDQANWFLSPVPNRAAEEPQERIQRIRVLRDEPAELTSPPGPPQDGPNPGGRRPLAAWERPTPAIALAEADLAVERPEPAPIEAPSRDEPAQLPLLLDANAPEIDPDLPPIDLGRDLPELTSDDLNTEQTDLGPVAQIESAPVETVPLSSSTEAQPARPPDPVGTATGSSGRQAIDSPEGVRSERSEPSLAGGRPELVIPSPSPGDLPGLPRSRDLVASLPVPERAPSEDRGDDLPPVEPPRPAAPELALARPDLSGLPRASREDQARPDLEPPKRSVAPEPVPLVRATPTAPPRIPEVVDPSRDRRLPEIPEVYRSRLAPNRSELALAAGATPASEQAVERALVWLSRHQDQDGRWNAGRRRVGDGRTAAPGETSFSDHCPPDDVCEGDCFYWEADTAVTGLALLAYLGAGHTHHQPGPYARTVTAGLNFLLRTQKPDGDLRGISRGVGMYCHAIATLALCEAYALSGDERLRGSVERAVSYLMNSRARDGQSWRYAPDDPFGGDTSILGWAILVWKSATVIGLPIPSDVRQGALKWLDRVARGDHGGLAVYRPFPEEGFPVTPTMTAEAWACRQFLGTGGPGLASDEAATYLLLHGPDRAPFNLYYWYYATLAMYQHGGPTWNRWNDRLRDQLVRRQVRGGHADGSWDPADCQDQYDLRGGRVYTTALAALTLEVYYRYLRLYDAPASASPPPALAPASDDGFRRAGFEGPLDNRFPVPDDPS